MKQKAFTLAEILMAVGIIGILAAVTVPTVNKFKPDTTKVMYINVYDSLVSTISSVASSPLYYPEADNNFIYSEYPLMNLQSVVNPPIAGGPNKLCRVLANVFESLEDANEITALNACGSGNANDSYTDFIQSGTFNKCFTGKNGVEYMIKTNTWNRTQQLHGNQYRTDIVIDVDGENKGPNCAFSAQCTNPDRFLFRVTAAGEVIPSDRMGIIYLETRTNLRHKDISDYEENAQLMEDVAERLEYAANYDEPQAFDLPSAVAGDGDGDSEDGD